MKTTLKQELLDKAEKISAYNELGDFYGSLKELKEAVERLIAEHGEDSIVMLEAGYNNVECHIITQESIQVEEEKIEKVEQARLATQTADEKSHLEFLNFKSQNGNNKEVFTKKEAKTYKKLTEKYA